MNINKINQTSQGKVAPPTRKQGTTGFEKVFTEKLGEINSISQNNSVEEKVKILEHGDKILNLLDDYGKVLTDPSKSLKEIEPLVDRIEEEVSLFEVEAEKIDSDDKLLDRLTHDLSTTAQVALFKFRRGDFL